MTVLDSSARFPETGKVALGESSGRWVLLATVLGSALVFIDGTVVNIALPAVGGDLGAGLQSLTWVVNAFALALAALILLGGALSDRFGRRRIFVIGVVWFTLASTACAAAPNVESLIAARALQGVGGALLTPGSLAIIHASYATADRGRAVGAWSGLAALTGAASPLLGGWLLMIGTWRWIFLINIPVALVILLAARHIPETRSSHETRLDLPGTALAALGLAALTYGVGASATKPLITMSALGWLAVGLALLSAFALWERRVASPLLPATLLTSRLFIVVNAVTFLVYAALAGAFFWVVLQLQVVAGLTPLQAGLALSPASLILVAFSVPVSAWGKQVGPRLPLMIGPTASAVGVAALTRLDESSSYWVDVLPALSLFAVGLVVTVGPLTAAALASVPDSYVGIASGVNNTVARAGGLLAIAALPALGGLSDPYTDKAALEDAYGPVMWSCACLLAAGVVLASVGIPQVDSPGLHQGTAPARKTPKHFYRRQRRYSHVRKGR